MKNIFISFTVILIAASCKKSNDDFDATGTFEAREVIVSSGIAGKIVQLNAEEGQLLDANSVVGFVDTTQLFLKKKQLQAQIKAVLSKQPDINTQLSAIQEQIKTANTEKVRIMNLLTAGVATQKQLDDINNQISVLQKQLDAQRSVLETTSEGIYNEANPLSIQIAQIDDQLTQSLIINPVPGTVLTKYAEQGEFTTPGKAIYKIADLHEMTLRAYITGDQLAQVKLNQEVKIRIDDGNDAYKEMKGTIYWIANKAEFTPKTIQTKDERANLVYAIKIRVINEGSVKIGMYGEVLFH